MKPYLPEGYAQCAYLFTGSSIPLGAAMTFGVQLSLANLTPAQLADQLDNIWGSFIKPLTSTSVTLAQTHVKFGPSVDGPFITIPSALQGTLVGTTVPPNVAGLVKKVTALGGKVGVGRMYMPGLAEADVDEKGALTSTTLTNLQNGWGSWYGQTKTISGGLCLIHTYGTYTKKDGTVVNVPARQPTMCTNVAVDTRVATQRRRLRG